MSERDSLFPNNSPALTQAQHDKLLIVDFAPHTLEFLRESEAHDRLGFSGALVSQWLQEAGLLPRLLRDLKPSEPGGSDKLTVSLWLAQRPPVDASTGNLPVKRTQLAEFP